MSLLPQPRAKCFYCETGLHDDEAKLSPMGRIYGPCCEDLDFILPEDAPYANGGER